MTKKLKGLTPCRSLLAAAAFLAALASVVLALAWQSLFDHLIRSQMVLSPTSRSYQGWLSPPESVPIYFDVYLFNWTNPEEFPDKKPRMEQLGPYRFREHRRKTNLTWHSNNDTVSYRSHLSWNFDPITSNGSLDDNVTTLNMIAAGGIYRAKYWSYLKQKGLSMTLSLFNQGLYVSSQAGKLLFEGYRDPILDLSKASTDGSPVLDKFGWFYQRNNSYDVEGHMEVSTGAAPGTLPGQILKLNFQDHLQYYKGECSKIYGSMGEFLPRGLTPKDQLPLFMSEMCRTVLLNYVGSGEMQGLNYLKFAVTEESLDQKVSCYCGGECGWTGGMNISACRYGSPVVVTLPHFLHADQRLTQYVDGIQPDEKKHSFFFAVEPNLGVALEVAARFQLNIHMEPNPNFHLYENVPTLLFPILWIEQHVLISDEVASNIRWSKLLADWGAILFGLIAVIFSLATALIICDLSQFRRRPANIGAVGAKKLLKEEAEMHLCPK